MPSFSKKGMVLFIVIGVIMVSALLAIAVLRIIASNSRITHHTVSRIQAEYAAKAGVMYALDALRRYDAVAEACWASGGMIMRKATPGSCVIVEPSLSDFISKVDIVVAGLGSGPSGTRKITAKATYTYTP
jgi:Tfp pilus assembly protein PilX